MTIRYLTHTTSIFSGSDAEKFTDKQIKEGFTLEGDVPFDDYNKIQERIKAGEELVFFHVEEKRERLLRVFKK